MEKYTPNEKAKLQKSRTLSDANLIMRGAEYVSDSHGEPILNPTEWQRREISSIPGREKLWKIFNKIEAEKENKIVRGYKLEVGKEKQLINTQMPHSEREILLAKLSAKGEKEDHPEGDTVTVSLSKDFANGQPCLRISRKHYYFRYNGIDLRLTASNPEEEEYYSFQEFYDNLRPEEREKGEAWGKEMENYLEEK